MKRAVVELLRCLACGSPVSDTGAAGDGELLTGQLECVACHAVYELRDGVPVFLPDALSSAVAQVRESYSSKWGRIPDMYDEDSFSTRHNHDWYLERYRWGTDERLAAFLRDKRTVLDAGCGLGRDVRWYAALNRAATVVGADISDAAFIAGEKARRYPNASVVQGDLNRLPFAPETFDFVVCDQVLPCVEDPRAAVEALWRLVRPGGHLAFYAYKKKSVIREFTDDYLREKVTRMGPDEAWRACVPLTELGKALSDLHVEFELPSDIPELDIKAGRYDLQRFLYYNVLKIFWNDGMTFDENNLVNLDWFHPAYTYRHTADELRGWADELGMIVEHVDEEDPSGISVLARKDGAAGAGAR